MNTTTIETVTVPANLAGAAETLYLAKLADGRTSGLCTDRNEAMQRAHALGNSEHFITESPRGQASTNEMRRAVLPRGMGTQATELRAIFDAAFEAGLGTVEWALASRCLRAGLVQMAGR